MRDQGAMWLAQRWGFTSLDSESHLHRGRATVVKWIASEHLSCKMGVVVITELGER